MLQEVVCHSKKSYEVTVRYPKSYRQTPIRRALPIVVT